ncbi:hypothetical protein CVT24_007164 [Panaeolus cyanescens]|uniref:Uncharacterized protein n=1 Tax=Panaeolus cyanescens TaxID=181874 RepID=A0A409YPJ7_9AGAR|nr:hypothetical protein CVT24_007164 [Panaeolus cyanescens]
MMAQHLKDKQPDLGITDRDVLCVAVAGLCHDLGHGPWSHVWDGMFIPEVLRREPERLQHLQGWTHEKGSEMLFNALVKDNNIQLQQEDFDFIKALIAGEPLRTPHEKIFLFDIVANKRNGLDVDKFDYIHRDSHTVGSPISISLDRIINSARVLDNQICYDIKDANHIYEICAARFKLHKIFYNHKSAKAIEYMIIDALLAADPHMNIVQRIDNPKSYLYLTDSILERIEESESDELEPARAIIDRIRVRDLYQCVDYKCISWPARRPFLEYITPQRIVDAANALAQESGQDVDILKDDVVVDSSIMHYGMKQSNPLDSVKFYSKRSADVCAHPQPGDYSLLMPTYFAEVLLRIFSKNKNVFGIVQAGYRKVLKDLQEAIESGRIKACDPAECSPTCACACHFAPLIQDVPAIMLTDIDDLASAPTPPATEAPSTPKAKAHSRQGSFSFSGMGGGTGGSASTPFFNNNSFTTVPPNYVPPSPSAAAAKNRKPRSKVLQNKDRNVSGSGNSSMESIGSVDSASTTTLVAGSGGSGSSGSLIKNKKRERDDDGEGAPVTEREVKKHRLKG